MRARFCFGVYIKLSLPQGRPSGNHNILTETMTSGVGTKPQQKPFQIAAIISPINAA